MAPVQFADKNDLDARIVRLVRYSWMSDDDIAKIIPNSLPKLEQLWFRGYLERAGDYYKADLLGIAFLEGFGEN